MKFKARKGKHSFKCKQRQSQNQKPSSWILIGTIGTLVAYNATARRPDSLLFADEPQKDLAATYSPKNFDSLTLFKFELHAGNLSEVLKSFQKITGIKVIVSNDSIFDLSSPGVTGLLTAEQALVKLLESTGVSYRFISTEEVTLEIHAAEESVEVVDSVTPLSSPKYTAPLLDTPQTITVIPKNIIEEQGATTLRDVLRNVPGLTITAGEGGTPAGDNLTLRGFSARNDVFVDGVRDIGPQTHDPFNLESVEVVKGPDSVYTGRGSTGGVINLVSKAPTLDSMYEANLNVGSENTTRVTADMIQPLESLGLETSSFRMNLMIQDSNFPGRSVVENERWGVAPSVGFGLGTSTRFLTSYFHLEQNNISDYGIPWVPVTNKVLVDFRDRPAPVPRDTFYGFLSRDKEELSSDLVTARYEHDFQDSMSFRNQLRYGHTDRDSIATPPRFASDDSTIINREMRSWLTEDIIIDNQADLQSKFNTAGLKHNIVTGLSLTNEQNERHTRVAANSQTTLLNPNPNDVYEGEIVESPIVGDVIGKSFALYAFDTVELNQKWDLNGGLRYDYFDVDGTTTLGLPVARLDKMLSWRAGTVFKPTEKSSLYAAAGTSLNPSLEGLSYQTANTAIEPEKTYTYEAGGKFDVLNSRLSINGAIFRVDKTNARTPGLTPDEPVQVLEGRQRVDGLEFSASGTINRHWEIFGGYTYLESEILESNNPLEVGKDLQNTPKHSLSFWLTYEFPHGFTLGGGPRYVSKRFGNNINTRFVDGYWLLDLMASYPITKFMDLRLNLYNVTDEYYFDRLGGGHLIPGAARAVLFSVGFNK